jgi:hypothetical protein
MVSRFSMVTILQAIMNNTAQMCSWIIVACAASLAVSCGGQLRSSSNLDESGTFGSDLTFLKTYHKDLIVLQDSSGQGQVVIAPQYQGRVMTSTTNGLDGVSMGWLNRRLISSQVQEMHINAYGGEERLWLGPEGGQYGLYFRKNTAFDFEHWFVPKEFDTEPFEVVSTSASQAVFKKVMLLENYSGTIFNMEVSRKIKIVQRNDAENFLDVRIPSQVGLVAFESQNTVTNIGTSEWNRETGKISIWILSMLNAGDSTTVLVPFVEGDSSRFGPVVNDAYFGTVPSDRLSVEDGFILFKADGKYRSKIGVSPRRAKPVMLSLDESKGILTIAQFSMGSRNEDYVNSSWSYQKNPFGGDVVNAYNDGPVNGKQMGQFYELESSSPAPTLRPGETVQHWHRTIHLTGELHDLKRIATELLKKQ